MVGVLKFLPELHCVVVDGVYLEHVCRIADGQVAHK